MRVHGILMALALLMASAAFAETPVAVCAEPGAGPPWLYWKTAEKPSSPKILTRFSIDMYQGTPFPYNPAGR